jgi:phage virion morphogenesis protein
MAESPENNNPLKETLKKTRDLSPLTKKISETMYRAVMKNFAQEGRPKWKKLAKRTRRQRNKKGYTGKILQRTGGGSGLKGSIQAAYDSSSATVGTNKIYGRIHQEGGTINIAARSEIFKRNRYSRGAKKGKFKKGTTAGRGSTFKNSMIKIPARPFLKLDKDDLNEIERDVKKYLTEN